MKLEGLPDWGGTDDISDTIKILKMIRSLTHQATYQKFHTLSLYSAIKSLYWLQQGTMMNNANLVDKLKYSVEVL